MPLSTILMPVIASGHIGTRLQYRPLNATVAQPKNCPFAVNTTIELRKYITTSDNTGKFDVFLTVYHSIDFFKLTT